jgi:hypothetical protein
MSKRSVWYAKGMWCVLTRFKGKANEPLKALYQIIGFCGCFDRQCREGYHLLDNS